jgi:hypothetical protein
VVNLVIGICGHPGPPRRGSIIIRRRSLPTYSTLVSLQYKYRRIIPAYSMPTAAGSFLSCASICTPMSLCPGLLQLRGGWNDWYSYEFDLVWFSISDLWILSHWLASNLCKEVVLLGSHGIVIGLLTQVNYLSKSRNNTKSRPTAGIQTSERGTLCSAHPLAVHAPHPDEKGFLIARSYA